MWYDPAQSSPAVSREHPHREAPPTVVGVAIIVLLLGYGLLGVTLAKRSNRTDGE